MFLCFYLQLDMNYSFAYGFKAWILLILQCYSCRIIYQAYRYINSPLTESRAIQSGCYSYNHKIFISPLEVTAIVSNYQYVPSRQIWGLRVGRYRQICYIFP